jgi:hypothetical protein
VASDPWFEEFVYKEGGEHRGQNGRADGNFICDSRRHPARLQEQSQKVENVPN